MEYRPFDLIGLMQIVENAPTTMVCKPKRKYAFADLARWAKRYRVPLSPNPNMSSIDSGLLRHGAVSAIESGNGRAFVDAGFKVMWASQAPASNIEELCSALAQSGLADPSRFFDAGPEQDDLEAFKVMALEDGVFGSPTFKIGDDIYFGNDRLLFVEEALSGAN